MSKREMAHPRAGGEHSVFSLSTTTRAGSSPRGRGTRGSHLQRNGRRRLIPARAGNTAGRRNRALASAAHPRAGGEHSPYIKRRTYGTGSSPRGRGTRFGTGRATRAERLIPARAGNTSASRVARLASSAHPRAGGEHTSPAFTSARSGGSSPRGRGTPADNVERLGQPRLIPARAGNTWRGRTALTRTTAHPRAGGEHCGMVKRSVRRAGSSPRGRGTLNDLIAPRCLARLIPARAGNTPT